MASRVAITPLSAAHTLVSWIADHGREPSLRETRRDTSLLSWDTYMRKLGGATFSGTISAARELVTHAPKPRMQHCLGSDCTAVFVYDGHHFCVPCRKQRGNSDDADRRGLYGDSADTGDWDDTLPTITRADLRAYGLNVYAADLGLDEDFDSHEGPKESGSFWRNGVTPAPDKWNKKMLTRQERKRRFVGGNS
jgi:hypothetical protein